MVPDVPMKIRRNGPRSVTLVDDTSGLRLEIDASSDNEAIAVEAYDYYGRTVEVQEPRDQIDLPHPERWFRIVDPLPEGKVLPVPRRDE